MPSNLIAEFVEAAPEVHRGNAAKEVLQRYILTHLAANGGLQDFAFQGGTALRMLHQLPRYSEDLDFIYTGSNPGVAAAPEKWIETATSTPTWNN